MTMAGPNYSTCSHVFTKVCVCVCVRVVAHGSMIQCSDVSDDWFVVFLENVKILIWIIFNRLT